MQRRLLFIVVVQIPKDLSVFKLRPGYNRTFAGSLNFGDTGNGRQLGNLFNSDISLISFCANDFSSSES